MTGNRALDSGVPLRGKSDSMERGSPLRISMYSRYSIFVKLMYMFNSGRDCFSFCSATTARILFRQDESSSLKIQWSARLECPENIRYMPKCKLPICFRRDSQEVQ